MYKLLCSVISTMMVMMLSVSTTVEEPLPKPVVITAEPIIVVSEPAKEEAVVEDVEPVCETENLDPSSVAIQTVEEEFPITDEEIELLALVTMAEAEGECEEGKRLVIDTVLNRMDSELRYFPDTVYDVIYQKNAFSSMWGERIKRIEVTEEVIELVKEELRSRTNSEVLYFRTKHYPKYGTPLFDGPVGNHYFSG